MTINRQYPIVHSDTVLGTGTKKLTFEQPESFVDFSDGNETGVRFHLDIHKTTGTFDSFKVYCKFQIGMSDFDSAGFSKFRWYDLQPEQVKTMIMEGVDWYGGTVAPSSITNLISNPSWVNSADGTQTPGDGAVTPSRPATGGFVGDTFRRLTFTKATVNSLGTVTHMHGRAPVQAGERYSASIRFASNISQRFRVGIRWYSDAATLTGQDVTSESAAYPATSITTAHRGTISGVAPEGATAAMVYVNSVDGAGAQNWSIGDTLDIDMGMIVKGSYLPLEFDGDSPNAVWNGSPHASTSTLTVDSAREPNVVASSNDVLPLTVSRSIKGFGQLVRVVVKPVFVNGSADAGITYSLLATH